MNFNQIALVTGLVVSGMVVSSVVAPANASVLYDSLTGIPSIGELSITPFSADSFSTQTTAEKLTSVVLSLKNDGSNQVGTTTLNLLNDNNINPGSNLLTIATINNSALTSSLANYTYTLATPYILTANTRYWIELNDGGNSTVQWSYEADNSGVGVANEYSFWQSTLYPNDAFATVIPPGGPFQLQVNATAVPEPLTVLGALTALGLGTKLKKN